MSLNWDLTNVKDYEKLCYIELDEINEETGKPYCQLQPLTNALIWAGIPVGLNGITEDNYVEWWHRLAALQSWHGAYLMDADGNDKVITLADVKAHIGLDVNVGTECIEYWWQKSVRRSPGWKKSKSYYDNEDRRKIAQWDLESGHLTKEEYVVARKALDHYYEADDDWALDDDDEDEDAA